MSGICFEGGGYIRSRRRRRRSGGGSGLFGILCLFALLALQFSGHRGSLGPLLSFQFFALLVRTFLLLCFCEALRLSTLSLCFGTLFGLAGSRTIVLWLFFRFRLFRFRFGLVSLFGLLPGRGM